MSNGVAGGAESVAYRMDNLRMFFLNLTQSFLKLFNLGLDICEDQSKGRQSPSNGMRTFKALIMAEGSWELSLWSVVDRPASPSKARSSFSIESCSVASSSFID